MHGEIYTWPSSHSPKQKCTIQSPSRRVCGRHEPGVTQEAITTFQPTHDSPVQTSPDIRIQVQNNMSFYKSMLKLTGGALAWGKCTGYILQFYWSNGLKFLHKTKEMYPALDIPDVFTNELYHILLANPSEAFRILGAFVARDANTKKQVEILVEKCQEWASRLDRSYLSPHEAITAYTLVLFPALIYPVAVLALTEDQCDEIVRPALKAVLKNLNIPFTTSRLLLYGPARYGGPNIPNLYVQEYIIKLMMVIGHLQKKGTTATILDIVLGTSQQQVGVSKPILETDYIKYGFLLDDGWIKSLWKFLYEMNGSLIIRDIWTPQSNYSDDIFIMDKVLEIKLPESTVKKINLCRLHKEYYHLSHILDSKQRLLHRDVFIPSAKRANREKFPSVSVPKSYWNIWENVIKTIYQSVRVSGMHFGMVRNKESSMWMQHKDQSHIIRNCGDNKFIKYKSIHATRNTHTYTRQGWYFTTLSEFSPYNVVQIYEKDGLLFTDGCHSNTNIITSTQIPLVSTYEQIQHTWQRIYKEWITWKRTNQPNTANLHIFKYYRLFLTKIKKN